MKKRSGVLLSALFTLSALTGCAKTGVTRGEKKDIEIHYTYCTEEYLTDEIRKNTYYEFEEHPASPDEAVTTETSA